MKIVLVGAVVLVTLIAVVVVVGYLLPRDHVVSRTTHIEAPMDSVWHVLVTPAEFPQWRHDVKRVELLPASPTGPVWREFSRQGGITMAIDAAEPPQRLVTRIADTTLAFGGSWEFHLQPDGAGSRVTVTERGSVYNPLFRFVSRFVMGHTATVDAYLRALGRHFGHDVTISPIMLSAR
jgi:uncharacterized protein YndB with AHSA1/START domain